MGLEPFLLDQAHGTDHRPASQPVSLCMVPFALSLIKQFTRKKHIPYTQPMACGFAKEPKEKNDFMPRNNI